MTSDIEANGFSSMGNFLRNESRTENLRKFKFEFEKTSFLKYAFFGMTKRN